MVIKPPQCPPILEISKSNAGKKEVPRAPENLSPKLLKTLEKYKYNWRIEQLSKPIRKTEKFDPSKKVDDSSPKFDVRLGKVPSRIKDVKVVPMWKLLCEKKNLRKMKMKKKEKKKRMNAVNKNIKDTYNSVYYYYRKKIAEKTKKAAGSKDVKKKGKQEKGKGKLSAGKVERLKKLLERCAKLAIPKKVPTPPVKPRKVVKNWNQVLVHLDTFAEPKRKNRKYKRPSKDSQYEDITQVKPTALKYKMSPHMDELAAKIPMRYKIKVKPIIPGEVKKSALKAKISPRIQAISEPKRRADAPEMDVKENAFAVSKNALKYKITPRVEELAKPVERR